MIGNVGSGKTTWIKKFVKENKEEWLVVSKDALRTMLGGGYYKYDESLEPFIDELSKTAIQRLLSSDKNIIIDETNMDILTRADLVDIVESYTNNITAVVMPTISKEISMVRKSLKETNYGYAVSVWEEIWERKSSKYIKPDKYEGFDYILEVYDEMS